jgi:O-antigen/teichoic acid export membrane protein
MTLAYDDETGPVSPLPPPGVPPVRSLRARLASGAFWTLLAAVGGQGLAAIAGIVIARVLGKGAFGELGMLRSTLVMFDTFASLGGGVMAGKYVAELRQSDPARAGRLIGLAVLVALASSGLMTVLVLASAGPIARHALDAPHLDRLLRWMAPVLPFSGLAAVCAGALGGLEAFRKLSLCNLGISIVVTGTALAGVRLGGVAGVIAAQLGCTVLTVAVYGFLLWASCRKAGLSIRFDGAWDERRIIWLFALPSVLGGIMVGPIVWVGNAILVHSRGGYDEMGLFNAANQWRNVLLFLPAVIAGPLLPIMSNLYGTGQVRRLRRLLIHSLLANMALVGVAAAGVAIFSRGLMRLYGAGFESAVPTLLTVLGVTVLLAAGTVVAQLITSTGAMWQGFAFNAMWAATLIGSAYLLVPRLGALGLGLSHLIAYLLHTGVQLVYLSRRLRTMEAL